MGRSSSIVEHHELLDVFQQPFSCKKRKQSVMSKRPRECTANEGSAVAKPRYVSSSVRKLVRNNNQDPTAYSQERRQDDTLSSGTGKLVQSGESTSSASTRKLVRGDDIQIERTWLEFHNVEISDYQHLETVFTNLQQKLNLAKETPVLNMKTNRLIWGIFVDDDESRCSSWTKLHRTLGSFQEHKLEIDIGTWSRNSECITDWLGSSFTDEIYACAWSSNQVDESKSTDSVLCFGKMQEAFRSEQQMEWSTWRISTFQFIQRIF